MICYLADFKLTGAAVHNAPDNFVAVVQAMRKDSNGASTDDDLSFDEIKTMLIGLDD